jgi:hypothetical protein
MMKISLMLNSVIIEIAIEITTLPFDGAIQNL